MEDVAKFRGSQIFCSQRHLCTELILFSDALGFASLINSLGVDVIFHGFGWSEENMPNLFFFFFFFLGLHLWHMEVPRLEVKSELQLPAYATATATLVLSHTAKLHSSLWQHWVLNPSEARDRTHILMDTSWVLDSQRHNRNSRIA